MSLDHGRTRYARGCRCNVCTTAERDYQRNRYRRRRGLPVDPPDHSELSMITGCPPADTGPVVGAVRAELDGTPAASERSGLAAVALALAAILDNPKHVPTSLRLRAS